MTQAVRYPTRPSLDRYTVDMTAERLPELLADHQPVHITGEKSWVLVPADLYDTMLNSWAAINHIMEQQRQRESPLPTWVDSND